MLTDYGKREWLTTLLVGLTLAVLCSLMSWWLSSVMAIITTAVILTFFRDPRRTIPTQRGIVVSPADGRISSIHRINHFQPFDGPATCIRIFLSVFNVHVNRSPCHGLVESIWHKKGQHLNALNPRSAETNESNLIVLYNPTHRYPVAAVRQVAGLIARTIVCGVVQGQVVQRGQRFGMIKFGSTTELYLPDTAQPDLLVQQGQRVFGGLTMLAKVTSPATTEPHKTPNPEAAALEV